ncbi:MAG: ABC transporter ATP-binding protein [Anaerolineales bacterium]|nr:ABC transporter ATP-binding protein [Anaerolineales bacterium]
MNVISTQDLSKQFDQFWAVDGVDLDVNPGQVLALLGPNGAGKTTTVRMLTSVLKPTRGTAMIAGYDVVSHPAQVRASVGVLTEQHGLYNRMPADEYLDFFGKLYGLDPHRRITRINDLLENFGLHKDRRKRLGEYSKGMRQKLALARALIHEPPVLLLDEPTSAMDPESARLVRELIQGLRSESRAFIICTHNLAEAEELADQIAIIRHGKIIARGSPSGLKQTLLGSAEYEVRLASALDGKALRLPQGAALSSTDAHMIRYRTEHPDQVNPVILGYLLEEGLKVISLQEVPRSLEQVYLSAINTWREKESQNGC